MRRDDVMRLRDRYDIVGGLLALTCIAVGLTNTGAPGYMIATTLEGATLLFVFWTSGAHRATLRLSSLLVALGVGFALVAALQGTAVPRQGETAINALLAVVAPFVLARRLARHERITLQTVLGALCLYLFVGLFFAFLFSTAGLVEHGSFFTQVAHPRSIDYLYFSFVTLTTVGYGDLTPHGDLGRMLSISEALFGQLYLVSVIALLISNLGRPWRGPMRDVAPGPHHELRAEPEE